MAQAEQTQAEQNAPEESGGAEIMPPFLGITSMRAAGYRNTAYALAELIDNAIQAEATAVEVLCIQRREMVSRRERGRLCKMAVLDNGVGMNAATLRQALQVGNGTRLNNRTGMGRFGVGLPYASVSQAERVDVWNWQNGADNAVHTYLDLGEMEKGMRHVPEPKHDPVPDDWRELSNGLGLTGTLVVWSRLDLDRMTWKSAGPTLHNTERVVGRIYRRFIMNGSVTIRLFAKEDGKDEPLHDRPAVFDDPLYLTQSSVVPAPFDKKPMFKHICDAPQEIEYRGEMHPVMVRYSVATQETVDLAGTKNRGDTPYGRHAASNIGVSVLRAGREIMLDQGWCIGYDPRERWWGAEVEFPPTLDEIFGVTNTKQDATHFSSLATTEWQHFAEEGEQFLDVVNRLKEEGDPQGWLLTLTDSLKRNIGLLRNMIKAQGAGGRSSRRRERHGQPDDVTATVNKGWKERSREKPVEGEDRPTTDQDLEEIRSDLTENKHYSETTAKEVVSLIREADLKVIFLEADFTNSYELFNVEMKGNVTEITFNRKHPAFDDIFGTVATVDEDVDKLSGPEALDCLRRAVNATKITFAAWARYEREAGLGLEPRLQKVRFDWGKIASEFLELDDDLAL